jgi:hypothetical protein
VGPAGINARALVEENRRQVGAYLRYAQDEQKSRQKLLEALGEVDRKMVRVQQEIESLGPKQRRAEVPGSVKDMMRALHFRAGQLKQERQELLGILWVRRAEVEGVVTAILENKPMEARSKPLQPTPLPEPQCPPNIPEIDGTLNRGLSTATLNGILIKPSSKKKPVISHVNLFGLDIQGQPPDLRAARGERRGVCHDSHGPWGF